MTPFQYITVIVFIITCMIISFLSFKSTIRLRKQRDRLAQAILDLTIQMRGYYPEGIPERDPCVVEARAAAMDVIHSENVKQWF